MHELNDKETDGNEYTSTHPSHEHRAEYLEQLLPDALLLRKECNCYELPKALTVVDTKQLKKQIKKVETNFKI